LLTEWTLKASGLKGADSIFLIKKGACAIAQRYCVFLKVLDMLQNALLCGRVEPVSDNKKIPCF